MQKIIISILVCFVVFVSCTKSGKSRPIDPQETFGLLKNKLAVVVDLREQEEMADGMVWNALWMPFSKVEKNDAEWEKFRDSLDKDKMVILYCAAGGRASKVAEKLVAKGFSVGNMGGFSTWKSQNLPTQALKK